MLRGAFLQLSRTALSFPGRLNFSVATPARRQPRASHAPSPAAGNGRRAGPPLTQNANGAAETVQGIGFDGRESLSDGGVIRPVSDAHLKAEDLCVAIQRDVSLRPRCRSAMFGIDTFRTGMLSGKRLTGALPSYLATFRVSLGRFGSLIVGPLRECKGRPTAGLKVEETKRSTTS